MAKLIVAAFALVAVVTCLEQTMIDSSLTVDSIDRTIDIASQVVKIISKIKISNGGSGSVKSFHYAIEEADKANVAFIEATSGNAEKAYLRLSKVNVKPSPGNVEATFYDIEFDKALASGSSETVTVTVLLTDALEMLPESIAQGEKQMTVFNGNHYAVVPYKCSTQMTKVTLASSSIESYSKLNPVSASGTTLTYGPYSNVAPMAFDAMSIHSENNSPFLVVTRMDRLIELSMWGNIAVEDTIDVHHNGAKLKGSFSRYDYQRENSGVSSVNSFKTFLPASARDVYYRDDIGNISTSAMRELDDAVELNLRPRFPLFGGWKTHYLVGYNVPSYEYLYNKGNDFVLNMRLVDHIFDDMIVEDFTLRVILPEGSTVKAFESPYPTKRRSNEVHHTYLDTQGRVVVVVTNVGVLTDKHIDDFQLAFSFPKSSLFREPLMLIVAFFLFFVAAMIYVRMDFSIAKDEGLEARLKVAGFCEKVASAQERRLNSYDQFDMALVKLKASKDVNGFQTTCRKISADHKTDTQTLADLATAMTKEAPADILEKITELQRLDRTLREHQSNQAILAEKLVGNKLGKQQFIEQEAVIVKKKDECRDKMASIVSNLGSM